jgi:sensor histidine kinase YesM
MTKRLTINALISSPIIGFYGVLPLFIFGIPYTTILLIISVLTLLTFIFWLINIYVLRLFRGKETSTKRYVASYGSTFVFHLFFITIGNLSGLNSVENMMVSGKFPFPIVYPFLFALAINTIILIISNSILSSESKTKTELELQQLRVTNLETQKQILTQQLQPHFLFNALSVLKSLIKKDPENAEHYALQLSSFLRYSVEASHSELTSLEDELRFTQDYIDLQKVRFQDSFTYTLDIPKEVIKSRKVPLFAIQTLVENAFKHNYFTSRSPLHISINYKVDSILISNNKVSMKVTERKGIGLANLNKRYELITGSGIAITDTEEYFTVSIQLINE